jgi:hypothetical protein
MKIINEYIHEILKIKDQTEYSGRTFLQNLLTHFAQAYNVDIVQEPKRDIGGKGAPDFKFLLQGIDIGYLENKKIGEDLDIVLNSEQIKKYINLTDNLILTDYLRWIWIYKGEVVKDVKLSSQDYHDFIDLINDFLSQKPQQIVKAVDLADKLSKPTRTIRQEIKDIVTNLKTDRSSRIIGTYKVFKTEISENISPEDFADAFAQTLTYSLFLTKITLKSQEELSLLNIASLTPKSFALIKDILAFINEIDDYPKLKPYVERLFSIINQTNAFEVVKDLQSSKDEFEDAYIHFYENFLTAYDPVKRKDLGVWYTPKPVVRAIINNLHQILKQDFNLSNGLGHEGVKVLDFACGTGTFLFEIYDKILSEIPTNSLKRAGLIKNHILKNIFGFELLIPAYCVSHLKLSQHLQDDGYYFDEDDRIGVYFTNTLESRSVDRQGNLDYESFFPAIAREGNKAQSIKDDNGILVITGNPPYNGSSLNNFEYIKNLIKPYFPKDNMKEKNPKWLQDDYVKFIRFAEDKIAKAGKGVVGIITNNGFLDNPTFRAMRKHLMETFDKIYIIDLHGSDRKKEKCPDGSKDENVFNIQQGVSISFFVKTGDPSSATGDGGDSSFSPSPFRGMAGVGACKSAVYHMNIYGKRMPKFKQISEIDLETSYFTKLEPSTPFYLFVPQDNELRAEYEKGWSLRDILVEMNAGIVTGKDDKVTAFDKSSLVKKITEHFPLALSKDDAGDCIRQMSYRPFDKRQIYYDTKTKGVIERARTDIMQHILSKKNIGLCFTRQCTLQSYSHVFITDIIVNGGFYAGGINYIAPLYLYSDNLGIESKIPNFKPEFIKMINERFNTSSPEQILGYIYAILHSPSYRKKYLEFLKIDFPRIPFDISIDEFTRLASLGQQLIDAHLMQTIPNLNIGEPEFDGEQNFMMEKVFYSDATQRLYFNKTSYFAGVSPAVWDFKIGGYQVLDKYLKSRKGLDISGDLEHIQNIIKILDFSVDRMAEVDGVLKI